jgi:hypothetical protein
VTFRAAMIGLLLAACGAAIAPTGPTDAPASLSIATASATPVSVADSAYGRITLRTGAGMRCTVGIHIGPPTFGDLPPTSVEGLADASGSLTLTYPAPHLPGGTGRHEISCGSGTASADFAIPATIPATRFSARIRVPAITELVTGVTARSDAALVPPRDVDVALLQRTLVSEWSVATRGLSTLDLVTTATADIVITVLAARATSVHVTERDGSQAIFLYVADPVSGTFTSDNFVAVALHELGHIWCCHGPDASSAGHWAQAVADPLLQGVDRFGLMNHPVQCLVFSGGIESCPNRFSERDLRAMGFTEIPPPPRNACVDAKNALLGQLATLKDQLAAAKAAIDATEAALTALSAQIKALEAKYPNGMPPDVYASYVAMIDRYNALLATYRSQLSSYDTLVTRNNAVVAQVNKLLC